MRCSLVRALLLLLLLLLMLMMMRKERESITQKAGLSLVLRGKLFHA